MLVKGTEEKPYQQHGAMPSTKYPSEIRNCGDNVNLFDRNNFIDSTLYVPHNDNKYSVATTAKSFIFDCTRYKKLTISKMSSSRFGVYASIEYPNSSISAVELLYYNNSNVSFSVDVSNYKYLVVMYYLKNETLTEQEILDSIKIEERNIATPYSKYGQGNVNFTISNKNICTQFIKGIGINSTNGSQIANTNGATTDFIKVEFNKNDTYYLSGLLNTLASFVAAYNKDKEFLGRTGGSERTSLEITKNVFTGGTAQAADDIEYIRIYQYKRESNTGIIDDIDNAKVQLEASGIATSYIEHKEQNFTFPLKQKLHKEDYLADDGIHHKRKQIILKGNENWRVASSDNQYYYLSMGTGTMIANSFMCTHYTKEQMSTTTGQIRIKTELSLEDWKAYLAEQYEKGTPVTIEYELAEEEIETYTEEQQIAYNKIKNTAKSYKGTTHIFCTDEISCEFEATYIKDFETYVKSLITSEVQANES